MNPTTSLAPWPLVGREKELESFRDALRKRRNYAFVVEGPAGVGKSRLADACRHHAEQSGWSGRRATATEAASFLPLGALAAVLPTAVGDLDQIMDTLAAGHERLLLHVDDLHHLDHTSLVLLTRLVDQEIAHLIGTVRDEAPFNAPLAALVGHPSTACISLAALSAAETLDLLGQGLGAPVSRSAHRSLHASSGGNPLYLRELVRAALSDQTLIFDREVWTLATQRVSPTPRLSDTITQRLAVTDPQEQEVLQLLALCGPLPYQSLVPWVEARTLTRLDLTGLVQTTLRSGERELGLAHPLYGDVLRSQIPPLRQRSLYLAQIRRLEDSADTSGLAPLRRASWQLAATGTADPDLLLHAAELARAAHDYSEVTRLLAAVPATDHSARTRLLQGEAHWQLGQWREAETSLAASQRLSAPGDEHLTSVLTRVWNLASAGQLTSALNVVETARPEVREERYRRVLRVNDGVLRVFAGEPSAGLALLRDLEPDASTAPDLGTWVQGALFRSEALVLIGEPLRASALSSEAYRSHLQVADRGLAPHPANHRMVLGFAMAEQGELAEAARLGESAFDEMAAYDVPPSRIWAAVHLGRAYWLAGRVATARQLYAEAVFLARKYHQVQPLRLAIGYLAACAAVLGDAEAAEETLKSLRSAKGLMTGEEQLGPAWLLVARGRTAQAQEVLGEAAASARACGQQASEGLLLTDVARLGGASDVRERLEFLADLLGTPLSRARAQLAEGLAERSPERLGRAAEALGRLGAYLLAAEAAFQSAAHYRGEGRAASAKEAAERAAAFVTHVQGARTPGLMGASQTLTPREWEIALLAVSGHTSRRIADLLGLSVRTVDNHLQHIYTKTGTSSRIQLAEALDPAAGTAGTRGFPHD
ncbi:LuxR C-terminal-related transcriptional regulator [Streptomyces sp. NPDC087908]|uniref:LuxR C-terminal-related transcriptional regulator n=1 Tax=Streptomyces sp. NPDC087908 TaxID=3365820 RepID=UPI003812F874